MDPATCSTHGARIEAIEKGLTDLRREMGTTKGLDARGTGIVGAIEETRSELTCVRSELNGMSSLQHEIKSSLSWGVRAILLVLITLSTTWGWYHLRIEPAARAAQVQK